MRSLLLSLITNSSTDPKTIYHLNHSFCHRGGHLFGEVSLWPSRALLCSVEAQGASYHSAFAPQCIDTEARAANYTSSLNLPDKTLQFVKDHPLMDDSVTPIDNRPKLIKKDVNYTQIVVDRTQALDGTFYDVMFISTGGFLGKIGKFT